MGLAKNEWTGLTGFKKTLEQGSDPVNHAIP
jgi:hypothetical protein